MDTTSPQWSGRTSEKHRLRRETVRWANGEETPVDPGDPEFEGTIKAFEFGDIDPAFVELVRHKQADDESKNCRFYLVEDVRGG